MVENPPSEDGGSDPGNGRPAEQHQVALAINALVSDYKASQAQHAEHERQSLQWTRRMAIAAIIYAILTAALLTASGYSVYQARDAVDAANRAASAATEQARVANVQLELTQRAWLHVGAPLFTRPLVFDAKGARTLIDMPIENSGHSPAVHIWYAGKLVAYLTGSNVGDARKALCDALRAKPIGANGPGLTMFPGRRMPRRWG